MAKRPATEEPSDSADVPSAYKYLEKLLPYLPSSTDARKFHLTSRHARNHSRRVEKIPSDADTGESFWRVSKKAKGHAQQPGHGGHNESRPTFVSFAIVRVRVWSPWGKEVSRLMMKFAQFW